MSEDPGDGREAGDGGDGEGSAGDAAGESPLPRTPEADAGDGPDGTGGDAEAAGENREGPLSDVAEELAAADRDRDPPSGVFDERVDVDVDREALWRQVAGEEAAEVAVETADADAGVVGETGEGEPTVRRPDDADAPAAGADREAEGRYERVVEKSKYCEQCKYFSEPPEVHCTHEGTEIAEMVDTERFRLLDCPIVREDEELERV